MDDGDALLIDVYSCARMPSYCNAMFMRMSTSD